MSGRDTLKPDREQAGRRAMHVTADVVGGETHEIDATGTYADLIEAVGLDPHAATVLVDGRPVPDDREIDAREVEVLRLVTGG